MDQRNYIFCLSDEILLHILSYLESVGDLISLSESCGRFRRLLEDRSVSKRITVRWNVDRVQRASIVRFLTTPCRASMITCLRLNDLYWLPSGTIRDIVLKQKSLQELHVAGTQLSWKHLSQILDHPPMKLFALSWTWDNSLERDSVYHFEFDQFLPLRDKFLILRSLLIHVPDSFEYIPVTVSHVNMGFLISLCQNLEQLWIVSWKQTMQERMRIYPDIDQKFHHEMEFPKLHTFVSSIHTTGMAYLSHLTAKVLECFSKKSVTSAGTGEIIAIESQPKARNILVDYTSKDIIRANSAEGRLSDAWPVIDLRNVESFSLLLTGGILSKVNTSQLHRCKHILVSDGSSTRSPIATFFKDAIQLESFHLRTHNASMNWEDFVHDHPNLKAINNVFDSEVEEALRHELPPPYPAACIEMAKLQNLERLSIPIHALFEITSPEAIANYYAESSTDTAAGGNDETSPNLAPVSLSNYSSNVFKRNRKGVAGSSRRLESSSGKRSPISGIDYLGKFCPNMIEFELGFGYREIDRKLLVNSLSSISGWRNLKRLTLNTIPVLDGLFLLEITKSCTKLESLRITELGPRGKCIYINSLCSALKHCHNLLDFRLEQRYIGSTGPLFGALEHCPELERLFVCAAPNSHPIDERGLLRLMEKCLKLKVVYLKVESTKKSACASLRNQLESRFKKARPALSVVILSTAKEGEKIGYESIHFRELVSFEPHVCTFSTFPRINFQ